MIIVKKHVISQDGRIILAVCDKEVLGKVFSEGELQLDLSSQFYRGAEMAEADAEKLFKSAYIINFAGEKSVGLGIKNKLISKSHIIRIQGVPHAQAVL